MANIEVNVESLDNLSNDFKQCTKDYKESIDDFFKQMQELVTLSGGWAGKASIDYLEKILPKKVIYDDFGIMLDRFGDTISTNSELIKTTQSNNKFEN